MTSFPYRCYRRNDKLEAHNDVRIRIFILLTLSSIHMLKEWYKQYVKHGGEILAIYKEVNWMSKKQSTAVMQQDIDQLPWMSWVVYCDMSVNMIWTYPHLYHLLAFLSHDTRYQDHRLHLISLCLLSLDCSSNVWPSANFLQQKLMKWLFLAMADAWYSCQLGFSLFIFFMQMLEMSRRYPQAPS